MHRQLVLLTWPLPSVLLADHPNACPLPRSSLGGLLGDNVLESLHTPQACLECLAGSEHMEEVGIVLGLVLDDIVVGCWIEEWGSREVM